MNTTFPDSASAPGRPDAGDDRLGPAVRLQHVGIAFRGVRALDDVTFDIPQGGISAVIGPNGAGKTTLFNCISGIYRHEGEIALGDRQIRSLRADQRARAGVARTFQTPMLIEESTVYDNVALGALPWTRTGAFGTAAALPRSRREATDARNRTLEIAADVGLSEDILGRWVSELAHADRRRVEIARALVAKPRLLMLDEPAAGLSAAEADELLDLIIAHGEHSGMTALLVEHDVSLVMRVARQVAVLDAGKLLAVGAPQDVRTDPAVIAAYLGPDDDEEAA